MVDVILQKSTNPKKKYMVVVQSSDRKKTIHFGANGMSDFTHHHDEDRKQRYINRHKKNENFNNPFTAGFWALNILWNKPTIGESIEDTSRRYGLNIKKK